jgi:hypothetical protein
MGKLRCFFATLYPEMVDKLIIADIAPKFYPQHHQSGRFERSRFSKKPSRSEVEEILTPYISDVGTRQF